MIDSCGVTSHSRASLRDVWPLGGPKTILKYCVAKNYKLNLLTKCNSIAILTNTLIIAHNQIFKSLRVSRTAKKIK